MPKTIHRDEYEVLLALVKQMISKIERGVIRLDVMQLKDICDTCNRTLTSFCREYEKEIG